MFYSAKNDEFLLPDYRKAYESNGLWPHDAIEVSDEVWKTFGLGQPPEGQQRSGGDDGYPRWVDVPPVSLDACAAHQRTKINAALADALRTGMPYTMPDGSEDTVQVMAADRQNLLGLAMEAERLRTAGVTDAVQEFRALSNTRYPMTPEDVIAMTDAALTYYKALLQQSWDRKDAIASALAAEDRAGIEAVVW